MVIGAQWPGASPEEMTRQVALPRLNCSLKLDRCLT
jgi:hypothetical protein